MCVPCLWSPHDSERRHINSTPMKISTIKGNSKLCKKGKKKKKKKLQDLLEYQENLVNSWQKNVACTSH